MGRGLKFKVGIKVEKSIVWRWRESLIFGRGKKELLRNGKGKGGSYMGFAMKWTQLLKKKCRVDFITELLCWGS